MSNRLMDLAYDVLALQEPDGRVRETTAPEMAVLVRLAWHANDADGRAWPPVLGPTGLCAKTRLAERTVQKAIKALEAAKQITRIERRGHGVMYIVHPKPAPASGAGVMADNDAGEPPHDVHPRTTDTPAPQAGTPAPRAPKQSETGNTDDGDAREDAIERITGHRGHRIEHDWQPTKPVPEPVAKVVAGWPPGRLDELLEEFRDFWLSDAGKRAIKRDWDRTWWNRIRATIARDRQNEARDERYRNHRRGWGRPSAWGGRGAGAGAEPASLDD